MSDLIDKNAAIDAACNGADEWDGGINTQRNAYIAEAINTVSNVDAVPLDPLCDWLSKNG